MNRPTTRNARPVSPAFTLAELLVVISIIVLLLAIAVPSFRNLLYSSERSLAENQLRAGIAAARDAAIQSEGGDAAAYFSFTPGGRMYITPVVYVGTISDVVRSRNGSTPYGTDQESRVERDVFAPLATSDPVQLPRGWSIRAYTPPFSVENADLDGRHGWYENLRTQGDKGQWVFPETGFFDSQDGESGWTRQSFIVRFTSGTGELAASNRSLALVLDIAPTDDFRSGSPWSIPSYRADIATNQVRFARRILADRQDLDSDLTNQRRCRIIGNSSIDAVLVRPVSELGLYDERRLASALGAKGLNRVTGSLYDNDDGDPALPGFEPRLDAELFEGVNELQIAQNINMWIEGRYQRDNALVESESRIFSLQNYLGQMQEVEP